MNKKPDLSKITSKESQSLDRDKVRDIYNIIYDGEVIRSPYEIDREKTIYRTRQDVIMEGTHDNKGGGYSYSFSSYSKMMDLAKEVFLHHTFPAIRVRDEFLDNTRICHCEYPGHTIVNEAHLFHGNEIAQTMDNISLDIFAETNIPENRRPFYKRMVGSAKENTEWNTSLSSFSVSVPQPWYFSIIHGAELRLNIDTETKIFYSFRPEPTSSLKMQIRNDDNLWDDVNIDDYLDRISISPIPKLSPILDLHVTLYKCLHEYAQQLRTSDIEIPSEDIIILDKTDYVSGTVSSSIDNNDFVKRISILTEDYNIQDKSTYLDGIQGGHLEYSSGLKKIPLLNKLKIMYDNFWSSTESLPDMKNLYTVVFGTDNVFGEYDTSVNLGGLDSKLEIHIRNDIKCKLRIRLHVFKMIKYIEGKIHIISGINAENYK